MFVPQTKPHLKLLFFMVLSCVLMFTDGFSKIFHSWRSKCEIVVAPIEYLVDIPTRICKIIANNLNTEKGLLQQNTKLKAKLILLNAKLQKQYAVEYENRQLHALLQSSKKADNKVVVAEILAIATDPFTKQIAINKGSKDGIFTGQPIVDAYGVMGQIVQTNKLTSRAILITDANSAIPIQIQRTGLRAIVVGDPKTDLLKLERITNTTDINIGDIAITSGLDQQYPFGYPVGIVLSILHDPNEQFADIYIKPLAHLDRSSLVLLVWPNRPVLNKSIQAAMNLEK